MTRKKLDLVYMPNKSMRKATFNKRKKGIMKKIHDLVVLCDVEACAVIKSPFSPTPVVWPSVSGVTNVVERFLKLPEIEQLKKMVNHGTFLQQRLNKTKENNIKKMKDNEERILKEAMFQFLAGKGDMLKMTDINRVDLIRYIDQYLKELYHRRDHTLNQSSMEHGESSSFVNSMAPRVSNEVDFSSLTPRTTFEVGSSSMAPKPRVEEDSFSLAPAEVSSYAFQHELGHFNTIANNSLPTPSDQHGHYLMMNHVGVYDQHQSFNFNQYQLQQQLGHPSFMGQDGIPYLNQNYQMHQRFEYPPIMGQDGMYNPNQSQNQQGEWSMDETMNIAEEMEFSYYG